MATALQKKNLLKASSREKRFASLAKKEGKGNERLAKKAHGANKRDLEWETNMDLQFAKIRKERAANFRKKALT